MRLYKLEKVKNQYTANIEILKSELTRKSYVHSIQFEREFNILSDLWKKLIEVRDEAQEYNNKFLFSSVSTDYDPKQNMEYFVSFISLDVDNFRTLWDVNRPFYPEDIYNALNDIIQLIVDNTNKYFLYQHDIHKITESKKKDEYERELFDMAHKNAEIIVQKIDEVCELIRKRIVPEQGINID
jgi:hypothetical protein